MIPSSKLGSILFRMCLIDTTKAFFDFYDQISVEANDNACLSQ